MKNSIRNNLHILFDIDGTLTAYRQHALDRTFHGNFLFPVILDLAEDHGISRHEAERRILETERKIPCWDYPDFLQELELTSSEALVAFREWHRKHLEVYSDTVALVKRFSSVGIPVSVISNNPHQGCLLKLEQCGLADAERDSSCFTHILSTDLLGGCKGDASVWSEALAQLSSNQTVSVMIGDNPQEDGELAVAGGVKLAFILERGQYSVPAACGKVIPVAEAGVIPTYLERCLGIIL